MQFRQRFEAAVRENIVEDQRTPEVEVSAVLDLKDITPGFWRVLKQFAPFGPGNHNPVFVSKNVTDTGHSRLLSGNHLKLSVRQGDSATVPGMGFGLGHFYEKIASKKPFHLCFKIEEDHWKGETYLRMMVQDVWE